MEAQIILFESDCIKSEGLSIHTILSDTSGSINDKVVKNDLVRVSRKRQNVHNFRKGYHYDFEGIL